MSRIAKSDFFAGVFLSTILKSSKAVPMLCDGSEGVKRILFETDLGAFNTYIKYSTNPHKSIDRSDNKRRNRLYWTINFTQKEYDYLVKDFSDSGRNNLIAIVCTNKELTETHIAILTLAQAHVCLKLTTNGGSRTITVSRTGRDHRFICTGVNLPDFVNQPQPFVNHLRYFENDIEVNDEE